MSEENGVESFPSGVITRAVYAVVLLLVSFPMVGMQLLYSLQLYSGAPERHSFINQLNAVLMVVMAAVLLLTVGYRLIGIVTGRCTLDVIAQDGLFHLMRHFALVIMNLGLLVFAVSWGLHLGLHSAQALFVGKQFRYLMVFGIILFEFSRLLEREGVSS